MRNAQTSVFCGDFATEGVVLLAMVPRDAETGEQVVGLHTLTKVAVYSDPQNYWLLQLGRIGTGVFSILGKEIPFRGGFRKNVSVENPFLDTILMERGDNLALRASPRGLPPPLVGLSVIVEWGILSARRSARG